MDHGVSVYKIDNSVQSSLLSFLVLNPNLRFLSDCPTLRTLSCNISVSMVSLVLHLTLISPLVSLFYYLSFDTYHNYPHIFLYLLLLLAISNFSSLILLSSTFFHVLLLVHYNVTGLSLLLTSHPLVYISFISLTLNLPLSAICLSLIL